MKKEDLKKEFESGVVINEDNIHLYYGFMSDEDKETHRSILYIIHAERYKNIRQAMIKDGLIFKTDRGVDGDALHFNRDVRKFDSNTITYYYDISYFGIKDILKPIDEYIAEIKASEGYKAYLA